MKLADLYVLAVDCQATGANPDKGHLLEIGWMAGCAIAPTPDISEATAWLLTLPEGSGIPPAVRRITGISEKMLAGAVTPEQAGQRLHVAARRVARLNGLDRCPAVIHFARYETPFLDRLHQVCCSEEPAGLQIICTHSIAVRLFPDLPRRGIRALAGFLGHTTPELRRSADHVMATFHIWKKLVRLLQSRHGISRWDELTEWLAATPAAARTRRQYPMNRDLRLGLPDRPGVYHMQRANRDILYVGKAKSLKQRVNSYFRGRGRHAEHLLEMLTQARHLDYRETGTALEAAVLESDEIKRLHPPYNIALRPADRELLFFSRGLAAVSLEYDARFCVGPLPGGRFANALSAFARWYAAGMDLSDKGAGCSGWDILGIDGQRHAPPSEVLTEGLAQFRQMHLERLCGPSALRTVTRLGAWLWRRDRLSADAAAQGGEADPAPDDTADDMDPEAERPWTADHVLQRVEHLISRSAFLIRRARWFCLLGEATLAWASAAAPDRIRHVVVFENGAVCQRADVQTVQSLPVAPGCARSFAVRRSTMDLATYDRLRVVTTELRRLVHEERRVVLRLGEKAILSPGAVARVLLWI